MTYDPSRGANPYLGMDDTLDDQFDPFEDDLFEDEVDPFEDEDTFVDDLFGDNTGSQTPQGEAKTTYLQRSGAGSTVAGVPQGTVAGSRGGDTTAYAGETQVSSAQSIPKTIRRDPRQAAATPATRPVPSLQRPVPSPQRDPYVASNQASFAPKKAPEFLNTLASLALRLIAIMLRLAAIALSLYVIASAVLTDAHRATLVRISFVINRLVPPALFGQFVFETPFGGAFRGDLAIVSVLLFVIDWLCVRHANNMAASREMGA